MSAETERPPPCEARKQTPPAQWADASANATRAWADRRSEPGSSLLRLFLLLRSRGVVRHLGGRQTDKRATCCVLLRVLLRGSDAARQGLAGLALGRLQSDLNQKALVMIRSAFTFDLVHRSAGARSL